MYAFERFTERAKKTLTLAQEEAERWGHSYIGTEHLLLGLLRGEGSLAHRVLRNLDVDVAKVRQRIDEVLARQDEAAAVRQIVPTSRVKKVIELSFEEARRMGHKSVGTEHLLLGLLIEGEGIGAHVLEDLGVTLDRVRAQVTRLLRTGSTEERVFPLRSRIAHAAGQAEMPLGPDAGDLLRFATALAAAEGAAAVGLEHF